MVYAKFDEKTSQWQSLTSLLLRASPVLRSSNSTHAIQYLAEAFHWILLRVLRFQRLHHYLDDFIFVLGLHEAGSLQQLVTSYQTLTNLLGIPRKDSKGSCGTVASILGIEVDTAKMEARLLPKKSPKVLN
jgi:phage-related protein